MRWTTTMIACAAGILAGGCHTGDPDLKPHGPVNLSHRPVNTALFQKYNLEAVDNAVIREHTLYPYHFVQYSDQLTPLGQRDVYVLAQHYQQYAGPLNVRQGDEPTALYNARVQTVMNAMVDGGVAANRLVIQDGMPGGEGLSSDLVVLVLTRMVEDRSSRGNQDGTSGMETGQANDSGTSNTGASRNPQY